MASLTTNQRALHKSSFLTVDITFVNKSDLSIMGNGSSKIELKENQLRKKIAHKKKKIMHKDKVIQQRERHTKTEII